MGMEITTIPSTGILKATVEGKFDLAQSKQVLMAIAAAEPSVTDSDVLIDVRRASSGLKLSDIWELAEEFANLKIGESRKTAVVCPPDRLESGQFFAVTARGMGRRVQAFLTEEEALDWLTA